MSSNNLAKALEKLEKNPFYDKYAQRIAELQKTSPEEFLERVERTERSNNADTRATLAPPDTRKYASVLNPKGEIKGDVASNEKKLEDIFKLELVKDKDAAEIQVIWEEYHRTKEVICATIPFDAYKEILERTKNYGTFLFPLPRSQGYEFIVSQCHGHTVHFTPLLAFQVHKENAPECLTMVHYTELREKGIVLMRGEYDKNVLNGQEAQCLANQFQMYYNGKDAEKLRLLKLFTEKPDSFKHMDLVAQLENITLV
ncbi:ATP11 protein domain-containing protein [Phthorimaea operculella]|nr:ATP11 protein domain-containing protein [Phthorimaea operculella]